VTGGTTATLSDESALGAAEFALALTLQEHRHSNRRGRVIVRSAARIEADWLIDEFPDDIDERETFIWNADRERVIGTSDLLYRGLTLVSTKMCRDSKEASAVLRKAALTAGAEKFVADPAAVPALVARSALCAEHRPGIPTLDEEAVREGLSNLCEGMTSFKELRDANLLAILEQRLGPNGTVELARLTPLNVTLAGRRRVQVHYESGKPPWIASRLQDFFGLRQSPTIMGGQLPLVLHLLAPNQRAVQITTDLPGFWERHYPTLRKALMRRYPKHAWPENP
jgi:ATP-dependent helicase HrpB